MLKPPESECNEATEASAGDTDVDSVEYKGDCMCGAELHIFYKEVGDDIVLLLGCSKFKGNEDNGNQLIYLFIHSFS